MRPRGGASFLIGGGVRSCCGDAKIRRLQGINPTFYLIIPEKPASRLAKSISTPCPSGRHLARVCRFLCEPRPDLVKPPRKRTGRGQPRRQNSSTGRSGYGSSHFNITRRALRVLSTMSLALSDVKRIANLSRLELTEAQAGETLEKLNGIFALVEQMKAIDTSGVEPLSHPIAAIEPALALRLREDVVTESNRRDDYQQPAPATQDGLYLVPKVIE